MAMYERQQFDFLLQTAVERFVERIEQRFRGAEQALLKLNDNPAGEGIWLSEFSKAVFDDFLLNNIDGACFVLRSLAKRRLPVDGEIFPKNSADSQTNVESHLVDLASRLFSELLLQKSLEALEQHSGYQAVQTES